MTGEEAIAVLERGKLEPLYVLTGPNQFWRSRWLAGARKLFMGGEFDTVGVVRLDGVQNFSAVELELASGALFDSRKMVIVDGMKWSKKEEMLEAYLNHPVPDTLLVVIEEKVGPSVEKALGRQRVIGFADLSGVAFRRFVQGEADKRAVRWDAAAREEFCRLVDGNEYLAEQELEKLSLWYKDRIVAADVRAQVKPILGDDRPWDVNEALLRHNGAAVVGLIHQHLERGMAPLFLFVVIAKQVIQIDRARRAFAQGMSLPQFQRQEGLRDFVAKKLWAAARLWSAKELDQLLEWAFRLDVFMKTGYGEPGVWLVLWSGLWAAAKIPPVVHAGGE